MSSDNAIERLHELLDERGVEWDTFPVGNTECTHWTNRDGRWCEAIICGSQRLHVNILGASPEQAIAATLGNDGVAERIKSVYLVMVADDLLEDGTPLCAYLDVPSAEQRASRERCVDEDGVRHYAWVTEVKVVDE